MLAAKEKLCVPVHMYLVHACIKGNKNEWSRWWWWWCWGVNTWNWTSENDDASDNVTVISSIFLAHNNKYVYVHDPPM